VECYRQWQYHFGFGFFGERGAAVYAYHSLWQWLYGDGWDRDGDKWWDGLYGHNRDKWDQLHRQWLNHDKHLYHYKYRCHLLHQGLPWGYSNDCRRQWQPYEFSVSLRGFWAGSGQCYLRDRQLYSQQ